MGEWATKLSAVNMVVGDLERAKTFWREVFGLAPLDEEEGLAILRLGDTFFALRHDPSRPTAPADEYLRLAQRGSGQFSIKVDDVDAAYADLEAHGVRVVDGPTDRAWGMRTVSFVDPAGYTWSVAQDLP